MRLIMESEKRMAENYEIIHGIHIGDKEVVFGMDLKAEQPYLCSFYTSNEIMASYTESMIGENYLEMMELFLERVKGQCEKVKEDQAKVTVPREVITDDMCFPNNYEESIEGKVVAVRKNMLRPEYGSAEHQLFYVTGGNGAKGNSHGRACFCINLYSDETERWERSDIAGEVKPNCMPDWAKEKLQEIQQKEQKKQQDRSAR